MRLPGIHMDKALKQTFLSGIAGGLIFHLEDAAWELMPNYPPELGAHLDPNLPRNGELLAAGAPLALAWALPKVIKRHSAGMKNVKMGVTLFDAPKLLHRFVVNFAYNMGTTSLSVPMRVIGNNTTRLTIRPTANPTMMHSSGRYGAGAGSVVSPTSYSGIGKYRVR